MFIATLIKFLCRKRYLSFHKGLSSPQKTQSDLKGYLFREHLKSGYGQYLKAKTWKELPIHTYQDIFPWLEALTLSPIEQFVQTSGSSCKVKNIPYTKELRTSYLNLFKIWAYDLSENVLKAKAGKIFITLSPPSQSDIKDDTQFLSPFLRWALKPYILFPPTDPEHYQERVAEMLLSEKNLSILSIWNPTYLLHIMDLIEKARGPIDWKTTWPNLQLISCWTDGWAALPARSLGSKLPHATLQGKGLLATEAPLTLPLHNAPAPVPLIDEVFFEFEDSAGHIFDLGNVQMGETYELIISQKGGLLRYRLGDKVRISGKFLQTPCFSFVGRAGKVCDMVGEKLDALMVEQIMKELNLSHESLLLPIYHIDQPCYYLLLTQQIDADLVSRFEIALQKIHHYKAARTIGQLTQISTLPINDLSMKLHSFYRSKGMAWGEIKDTFFFSDPQLAREFLTYLG
jgi:hypothetical protein